LVALELSGHELRQFGKVGTLRDWEQRRYEPDQAAQAYLKVIAADAAFVARALAAA
jgi:DNA-binding transcriptional regulator YiaG